MEIIHSDLLMGSIAMSTCWSQGSGEGSTNLRFQIGRQEQVFGRKAEGTVAGKFCSSSFSYNRIFSGSVGNDCTEKDTKEQKEMPGKQNPLIKEKPNPWSEKLHDGKK